MNTAKTSASDVYGAYAEDSYEVAAGLLGDIDGDSFDGKTVEIDDVEYDVDAQVAAIEYNPNGHAFAYSGNITEDDFIAAIDETPYCEFSAIDWDDDDDIDLIIVYPIAIAEVSYVGSDYINLKGQSGTDYDIGGNDYAVYDGIAKGDDVMLTADTSLKTTGTFAALDTLTGKMTSYKGSVATIDGKTYNYAEVDGADKATVEGFLDEDVEFRTINGYIVYIDGNTSADVSKYLLVTGISGATGTNGCYQAEVLFADGKDAATISINKVDGAKLTNNETPDALTVSEGSVWTYEVNSGKYDLTAVKDTLEGYDADECVVKGNTVDDADESIWTESDSTSKANATITIGTVKAKFDPSAVVFLKDGDDYYVKSGSDMAKLTDADAAVVFAGAESNSKNALTVTFAYVVADDYSTTDVLYGYITSDIGTSKDGDDTVYTFDVWTGTGSDTKGVELKTDGGDEVADLAKGAIISYKLNEDGTINQKELAVLDDLTQVAITSIDGDDVYISEDGAPASATSYNTDDDETVVFFVNSDKMEGVQGAIEDLDISTESETDDVYLLNAYALVNGNDELKLLVVDPVNSEWK